MKRSHSSDFDWIQFQQLQDFYRQYLEHRLSDPTPHATFKRFLVARNQRPLCNLYDAWRKGHTMLPGVLETEFTFAFSCFGMKNSGQYMNVTLQRITR